LTIKRGNLQFVAYSHQKHRFTSPVRMIVHALKWSSRHGNQSLLISLFCARCFVKKYNGQVLPYWFTIERIFDSRWYGQCHWYRCFDDVY